MSVQTEELIETDVNGKLFRLMFLCTTIHETEGKGNEKTRTLKMLNGQ
jgi:hypothetical protein